MWGLRNPKNRHKTSLVPRRSLLPRRVTDATGERERSGGFSVTSRLTVGSTFDRSKTRRDQAGTNNEKETILVVLWKIIWKLKAWLNWRFGREGESKKFNFSFSMWAWHNSLQTWPIHRQFSWGSSVFSAKCFCLVLDYAGKAGISMSHWNLERKKLKKTKLKKWRCVTVSVNLHKTF